MKLAFARRAQTDLEALPENIRQRIVDKCRFFADQENPLRFAEHLTGFRAYRFRVGDYRAFFEVADDIVLVLAIRRRDQAYRGLE